MTYKTRKQKWSTAFYVKSMKFNPCRQTGYYFLLVSFTKQVSVFWEVTFDSWDGFIPWDPKVMRPVGVLCKENLPRCSTEPRILKLPFSLLSKASSMVGNVNLFGKMFSDTRPAGCHVGLMLLCHVYVNPRVGMSSRCCDVLSSLCSSVCIVRSEVTCLWLLIFRCGFELTEVQGV